jgi:exoribonuclease II
VLPGIHGLGYVFDIKFDKPFPVINVNMLPDNDAYGYCQYKEDTVRYAVICDFGIFNKPKIDKERLAYGFK